MKATTVDDVITILGDIVTETKKNRDRLGYYAALYRQVTLEVKRRIEHNEFDDGPRMSHFDASFANAYFAAYSAYQRGNRPSRSWQFSFERARSGTMLVLQDLVLGINAHVNLDLGMVAGRTFPGRSLLAFHDDFDRINDVVNLLMPKVRAVVEHFSPRLGELTALVGGPAELALQFSVDAARDEAWRAALVVAAAPDVVDDATQVLLDGRAKLLGRLIADPTEPVASVVRRIRETESTDVAAIIEALNTLS